MTELFRKKSTYTNNVGNYIKSRLPTWKEVLISTLSIILLLIAFLFFFNYDKKIKSKGFLILKEGETRLVSPITGTVISIGKELYSEVSEGNILFKISNDSSNISLKEQREKEHLNIIKEIELFDKDYQSNIEELKKLKSLYFSQISNLKQDKKSLIEEKHFLEKKLLLSLEYLHKWTEAARKGIISKLSIYDKKQEQYNLNIQLKQNERMLVQNNMKLLELENLLKKKPNELSSLKLSYQSRSNVLQEKVNEFNSNKESIVSSPIIGRFNTLNVKLGETVTAGQLLGTVSKSRKAYDVIFTILDTSSGLVKVGDAVNITLPSFPYQDFGYFNGKIKEISKAPMQPHEIQKYNFEYGNGVNLFKVISTIDKQEIKKNGNIFSMRSGMRADIEIILEKRRLIDWFIEPILKIQKKLIIDT